jgi:Protein of unknown function (DUF3727)/Protein of unknown function (DUF1292)
MEPSMRELIATSVDLTNLRFNKTAFKAWILKPNGMTKKDWGMDNAAMEDDAPTLSLVDEEGRSLLCYVERSLAVKGTEYVLLMPVDPPVEIFAWAADEESEDDDEEMLIDIDDEELEDVFPTARAVLAEHDLILNRTALTLTATGELPEVAEEDIITLDIETDSEPNYEQFQQLAVFFYEEQEYVICSPLDPLLFFAQLNAAGQPELVSLEELQMLLEMEEFQELRAQLEMQAQLFEDDE